MMRRMQVLAATLRLKMLKRTLTPLDVVQQTHLDQMGMYGDCAGLAGLHRACVGLRRTGL
jgi:hypothetical protein